MSANEQREAIRLITKLLDDPYNQICADCQSKPSKWASTTLGVFICIDCSGVHRSLGTHISFVRSCTLDTWTMEQASLMQAIGNRFGNSYWESKLPADFERPGFANRSLLQEFIKNKYQLKKWASEGPPPHTVYRYIQMKQYSDPSNAISSNSANSSHHNRHSHSTHHSHSHRAGKKAIKTTQEPTANPMIIDDSYISLDDDFDQHPKSSKSSKSHVHHKKRSINKPNNDESNNDEIEQFFKAANEKSIIDTMKDNINSDYQLIDKQDEEQSGYEEEDEADIFGDEPTVIRFIPSKSKSEPQIDAIEKKYDDGQSNARSLLVNRTSNESTDSSYQPIENSLNESHKAQNNDKNQSIKENVEKENSDENQLLNQSEQVISSINDIELPTIENNNLNDDFWGDDDEPDTQSIEIKDLQKIELEGKGLTGFQNDQSLMISKKEDPNKNVHVEATVLEEKDNFIPTTEFNEYEDIENDSKINENKEKVDSVVNNEYENIENDSKNNENKEKVDFVVNIEYENIDSNAGNQSEEPKNDLLSQNDDLLIDAIDSTQNQNERCEKVDQNAEIGYKENVQLQQEEDKSEKEIILDQESTETNTNESTIESDNQSTQEQTRNEEKIIKLESADFNQENENLNQFETKSLYADQETPSIENCNINRELQETMKLENVDNKQIPKKDRIQQERIRYASSEISLIISCANSFEIDGREDDIMDDFFAEAEQKIAPAKQEMPVQSNQRQIRDFESDNYSSNDFEEAVDKSNSVETNAAPKHKKKIISYKPPPPDVVVSHTQKSAFAPPPARKPGAHLPARLQKKVEPVIIEEPRHKKHHHSKK